jgi:hypothetical protein
MSEAPIKTVRYSLTEASRILSSHACQDLGIGTFTTTTQITVNRETGAVTEIVVEIRRGEP